MEDNKYTPEMTENVSTEGSVPSSGTGTTYQGINPNIYNTPASGQSLYNNEPSNLRKWNWGAFMFNIIWGIGNKSYLSLLCLVPFLNIIWMFVCGAKGNQWAWDSGCFKTAAEFEATQATWNRAGIAAFILTALMFILNLVIILPMITAMVNMAMYL